MPTIRELPSIDLSDFDLSRLDPRKLDLPKIDFPKVELPKVDFDRLPDFDRVVDVARDAAYVGIGMTVLGVNEVQVRRRAAQARLADAQTRVTEAVDGVRTTVVDTVRETVARRND